VRSEREPDAARLTFDLIARHSGHLDRGWP
jgi:hypothetical protein